MSETVKDKVFGELEWESMMNWWIGGKCQYLNGTNIWVHIYAQNQNDFSAIKKAYKLYSIIEQNEYKLREFAYSKIDELTLDGDLSELSSNGFCEKLTLESIIFHGSRGGCEIAFDDGDIFGGHIIVIDIDKSGNPTNVSIQG